MTSQQQMIWGSKKLRLELVMLRYLCMVFIFAFQSLNEFCSGSHGTPLLQVWPPAQAMLLQLLQMACQFLSHGQSPRLLMHKLRLLTISSTRNTGDSFGVGTTPVRYTFIDDQANTANCDFNVIVTGGGTCKSAKFYFSSQYRQGSQESTTPSVAIGSMRKSWKIILGQILLNKVSQKLWYFFTPPPPPICCDTIFH